MQGIISGILQVVAVLKALFELYKQWLAYQRAKQIADEEKKNQARNDAIDKSKKAESDAEIWESQEDIVRHK